jgi:methylglutaconyl-CoA hydratase
MTDLTTITIMNKGRVRTITLQRPERRNALTATMIAELTQAFVDFGTDSDALVLILTGAGESFCSGLDLEELQKMSMQTEADQRESSDQIANMFRTLHDCPKPTIAAVNGAAVAGGMGLATICDFTLAIPNAKFGYPEVKIGFIPAIVSAFLRSQVGDKQARDLLLTGRLISAGEAQKLGLVSHIMEPAYLLAGAEELAEMLLKNSPASLAATKALLRKLQGNQLTHDLQAAAEANAAMRRTKDFAEGLSSFLEKRKPSWSTGE